MKRYQQYIDGQWCDPRGGEWIETINPYSGEVWAQVPRGNSDDGEAAVKAARTAFREGPWSTMHPRERGELLRKLGDLIAENAEQLAAVEVRDNGKLMAEMLGQMNYLPQWYYYYGGLADKIEGAVLPIDKPDVMTYTRNEPLGVVVGITPWNSPLLLATWKLAPALAAGNTFILKPSEFTSASALELMKLVDQAGFPPGVINTVTGYGHEVGAALVEHRHVAKVAFTGGESGGRVIYQAAAANLKPVSLELGGKSPNIVFADANLDDAVKGAVSGIFAASGQTCLAGSRLLVERSIHDEFLEKLVAFASQAKLGDPADAATQVGPVTTPGQYQKVLDYIEIAKAEGARCVLGGGASAAMGGQFVEPTIFADVNNQMRIAQEEVFGPVLSVIPFEGEEEAIEIANDILYGLAAGIWTQNIRRAIKVSNALEAGTVWVNTYRAVSVMAPFGGYKLSGIGRENGIEAIKAYLQTKTVWISTAEETPNPFVMR
ncbi:MAG: aldehyde dehydrogenase [Immundisolibacteraceae bacterium]|nr:aldehyde dehydrogenase [Immundisolibacteraceae bacterium]